MRIPSILLLSVVAALVLAAPPARAEQVLLHGGDTMEGEVVEVTEEGITLVLEPDEGGEARLELEAGMLDPHWYYQRRDAAVGDDAEARLELALWAFEHGLFQRSRVQFAKARDLAPEAAKRFANRIFPGLKEGVASQMVDAAEWDLSSDRLKDAKRILAKVVSRFGDTGAASRARELLPMVRRRLDNRERAQMRMDGGDEQATVEAGEPGSAEPVGLSDADRERMDEARDLVEQARNLEASALQAEGDSTALDYYEQAVVEYRRAADALELPADDVAEGEAPPVPLRRMRAAIAEELVEVLEQMSLIYLSRGDYKRAREQAAKIRAVDASVAVRLEARIREEEAEPDWSWAAWARRGFAGRRIGGRFGLR